MFLHLFDDEKFVDVAINLFESASSGIHKYVVLLDVGVEKPTLVKSKNIELYYYENNNTIELVKIEGKYKGIFVHYLNKKKVELIQSIPKSTKLIWMIWGGDAYPLLDEPLLQKSYFNQQKLIYSFFQKSKLKNAIYSSFFLFEIWKLKRRNEQQFIIDTIKKFTHFSSVLINEEILFRKYLPLQSAKYMPFNYANTHQLLGNFVDRKIKGKKILIGNSGDPSNNHLEIFNKLKDDQRFSKSFILSPLSYGYAKYIDFIEEKGNEIFRERYIPLRKFMPLEEYTKVISECSICIMNHDRQQAVGNIISMIWMGSKVYLNEHNLVYQYFTNIGIKVYSIQRDLFSLKQNPFNEIDEEELSGNRKILLEYFGVENVLLKVKNIIRELE